MAMIAAMSVALFSCKDDEDPVIPVVSFQQATRTVDESAGTIDVPVQLDVAAPNDIQIGYSLSGTATEGTSSSNDYQALGTYGTISIAKGSTSGTLQLQIRQDELVEADETIIITLSASSTATLGSVSTMTITLTSDDQGSKVSFAAASVTVDETARLIDIQLTLDKAAGQDLTVDYSFNYELGVPTAIDSLTAFENELPESFYDFYVVTNTFGKLTIPAGSTTAKITMNIYSDFNFEDDELIELNLDAVSTGGQLGATTKHTITVTQEDGRAIGLFWNDDAYTDVDMDMFLWWGEDESTLDDVLFLSADASTTNKSEIIFLPKVLAEEVGDAAFGLSFVYYEGTADPLEFNVVHADFADGGLEEEGTIERFTGTYTLANLNEWDQQSGTMPQIEQTFVLTGGALGTPSAITVPTSGSRVAGHELPAGLKKNTTSMRAAFAKHTPFGVSRKMTKK